MHASAVADRVEVGRDEALEVRPRLRARDQHRAAFGGVDHARGRPEGFELVPHAHGIPLPVSSVSSGTRRCAAAAAVNNALALLWHSRFSSSGSESATTPAPAATLARPSRQSIVRMVMAVSRLPEKSK